MARLLAHGLVALALTLLSACAVSRAGDDGAPVPSRAPGTLRLASFNVHFIRRDRETGPWSRADWQLRKLRLDAAVKALDADIIGFQEMASLPEQDSPNLALEWLDARNPDYGVAASGRQAGFPSGQAVFYRKDRLRVIDEGWLPCDTPESGAGAGTDQAPPVFRPRPRSEMGWDYVCVWVRFATRDGRQFQLFNVHFHYRNYRLQRVAARAVTARVAPLLAAGTPVIVLGDTNALSGWRSVEILRRAGLSIREAAGASYHFNVGLHLYGAIDRIALSPGIALVSGPQLVTRRFHGGWPSDHYPLVADIRLPEV
ncbi:MAG: endonuclease [Rhodobacterales bacterium]|nr:MAG: endonuclease [Rhodobacterales bacterium]